MSLVISCQGIIGNCSCSKCVLTYPFIKAPWYLNLRQDQQIEPYLHSNDPIPIEYVEPLRRHHLEITEVLKQLDQMDPFGNTALELAKFKAAVQRIVDDSTILLSPIRRIPFEIVEQILLSTEFDDYDSFQFIRGNCTTSLAFGPWEYSQVCHLWRSVTLQCASLWSEIFARFGDGAWESVETVISIIDEGMKRSGSHYLDVAISYLPCSSNNELDAMRHLMSFSHRFASLSIDVKDFSDLVDLLQHEKGFKSLRTLGIAITSGEIADTWQAFRHFSQSSSLTHVTVASDSSVLFDGTFCNLGLPFEQLREFRSNLITTGEDAFDLLRQCPHLTTLLATGAFGMTSDQALRHANLEDLTIPDTDILDRLTLPSLKRLEIRHRKQPSDVTTLEEFISRSKCSLESLELKCPCPRIPLSLLRSLKLLTTLTFRPPDRESRAIISDLLRCLAVKSDSCLPRLERISLLLGRTWDYKAESYVKFLMDLIRGRIDLKHFDSDMYSRLSYVCLNQVDFPDSVFTPKTKPAIGDLQAILQPYENDLRAWMDGGLKFVLHSHQVMKKADNDGFLFVIDE